MRPNVRQSALFRAVGMLLLLAFLTATALLRTDDEQVPIADAAHDSILQSEGVVRHCITGRLIGHVSFSTQRTADFDEGIRDGSTESDDERRTSFQKVFDERLWGNGSDAYHTGPIASGPGSTLHSAQETILVLNAVIDEIKRRHRLARVSLLDVPCGDMLWMSRFLSARDDVDYTGVDIVPDLIDSHRRSFAEHADWQFAVSDIVREGITGDYDLILCRQMLQHLYHADVRRVLTRLSAAGNRTTRPSYLLTTTFPETDYNVDLTPDTPYRFRMLNLEMAPISLEPPLCVARDGLSLSPLHVIGLWRLPLRRLVDCRETSKFNVTGMPVHFHTCGSWTARRN